MRSPSLDPKPAHFLFEMHLRLTAVGGTPEHGFTAFGAFSMCGWVLFWFD